MKRQDPIRVLYLAPQRKKATELTAYTFIDEEIHALVKAGVEAFVLQEDAIAKSSYKNVYFNCVPQDQSIAYYFARVSFAIRRIGVVPLPMVTDLLSFLWGLRIEMFASQLVKELKIDLVHSHFGWPCGLGGIAIKHHTSVPLVASMRGMDVLVDDSIGYGLRGVRSYDRNLRCLLKGADQTIQVSEFIRKESIRLGAVRGSTNVILKGVDLGRFNVTKDTAECRKELGVKTKFMILTVAGLIPRKGIDFILHALAMIAPTYDFTFLICGTGPEEDNLMKLASELSIAGKTQFAGRIGREQISAYFVACDIFIHAAILEASGNVLLEAMASGKPVITTASGGPPEYVTDSVSGFVVPPRDSEALAEKIRVLLDDDNLRKRFGAEGRASAEKRFAYARMTQEILDVYEKACNGS